MLSVKRFFSVASLASLLLFVPVRLSSVSDPCPYPSCLCLPLHTSFSRCPSSSRRDSAHAYRSWLELDKLTIYKEGVVCQEKVASMITDSNQVCFVKMIGQRVQEEVNTIFDIVCRAGNFRYVDFLLLISVIPVIIDTAYLSLKAFPFLHFLNKH